MNRNRNINTLRGFFTLDYTYKIGIYQSIMGNDVFKKNQF